MKQSFTVIATFSDRLWHHKHLNTIHLLSFYTESFYCYGFLVNSLASYSIYCYENFEKKNHFITYLYNIGATEISKFYEVLFKTLPTIVGNTLFSRKIGFINILQNLPKNVCLFNYLKLNNNWHNLLEKSPYILTTNIAIYTYYFHQQKLKEKPTTIHATSLPPSSGKTPLSAFNSIESLYYCTTLSNLC